MTDPDHEKLEARARAAARAVHDAMDRPASTEVVARRSRGPVRALAVAAVVIVIAIVGTTVVVTNRADGPASDVTTFCAEIQAEIARPVDTTANESTGETTSNRPPRAQDYLLDAPAEIREVALRLHDALAGRKAPARADSTKLLNWFQLRCYPDAARPGAPADQQRFAPQPALAGLTICSATNQLSTKNGANDHSDYGEIAIFGDTALPDPYVAPMIGIASSRTQRFRDDNTETPVAIPGHPDAAISAMSAAFSNRIDGSQVITWVEGGRNVAVFGRSFGADRTNELVSIASTVALDGTRPTVAVDALPVDFHQLYRGSLLDVSPEIVAANPSSTFSLTGNGGDLQIGASVMWEGGDGRYDAIRFLAPAITPTTVSGRAVLMGPVVGAGPNDPRAIQLARWSPGPGVVLTALSLPGATQSPVDLRALITATRKLDRAEWEALIDQGDGCYSVHGPNGERATASGAASSSATSSPSPTSTTVAGGPPGP